MIEMMLTNTPIWVYILFVFLLFLGIKSCYKTNNHFLRLLILPAVFIVWSLAYFFSKIPIGFEQIGFWLGGILLGSIFGWFIVKNHTVLVEKEKRRLSIPGSPLVLIIILIFFSFRYYVGFTIAIHPEQLQDGGFVAMVLIISSFVLGILIGRTLNYLSRFKNANLS